MFADREKSRATGEPVALFKFGSASSPMEALIGSIVIGPGVTEFGYGTTPVTDGSGAALNHVTVTTGTDFEEAVDDLLKVAPSISHVTLMVSWHGTDLRAANCEIKPMVETLGRTTTPYSWSASGVAMAASTQVSQIAGAPALSGAPSDRSVYEAIVALKARGLSVTVRPSVTMDIASANGLPNPYGGIGQPVYPWHGKITCHPAMGEIGTVDGTGAAVTQINTFFGTATPAHVGWDGVDLKTTYSGPFEWSYRRFVLTMAAIATAADADTFLIGSSLVGLTSVRSAPAVYPAIDALVTLAADVTAMSSNFRVSYAADWREYHSHQPADGMFFPLDQLWGDANIDFVGINNRLPIADWRDGTDHLDRDAGYYTIYDTEYLASGIEGGELYDWQYVSDSDRTGQIRTPLTEWATRTKDIRNWWANTHYPRPGGVVSTTPTAWVAESKPIVFTDLSCPAINKGANQPSVTVDAKSDDSSTPYHSTGISDPAMQRAYIEAWLTYWGEDGRNPTSTVYGGKMLEMSCVSAWDARPHPSFPQAPNTWPDTDNWLLGNWLTGRLVEGRGFDSGRFAEHLLNTGDVDVVRMGKTYTPWALSADDVEVSNTGDDDELTIKLALGSGLDSMFIAGPPSTVVTMTVFYGHVGDDGTVANFPTLWVGKIHGTSFDVNELTLTCRSTRSSMGRVGLRRNYQLGCPFALYSQQCRADKTAATVERTVASVNGTTVTVTANLGTDLSAAILANLLARSIDPHVPYKGGIVEWTTAGGVREVRTVTNVTDSGGTLTIRGLSSSLSPGDTVRVSLGCIRQMGDCFGLHDNIHNFGGQPWIPTSNPLSTKNQYY